MEKHKIQKIELTSANEGEACSHIHLRINGKEIQDIRSLKIKIEPNEVPIMTLDLALFDLSITSDFLIYQKGVGAINFVRASDDAEP